MKKIIVALALVGCFSASPATAKTSLPTSAGALYYADLLETKSGITAQSYNAYLDSKSGSTSTSTTSGFSFPSFDTSSLSAFWTMMGF